MARREEKSYPYQVLNSDPSTVQPEVSSYTDRAIPAHEIIEHNLIWRNRGRICRKPTFTVLLSLSFRDGPTAFFIFLHEIYRHLYGNKLQLKDEGWDTERDEGVGENVSCISLRACYIKLGDGSYCVIK
jgi:hypothetical protein